MVNIRHVRVLSSRNVNFFCTALVAAQVVQAFTKRSLRGEFDEAIQRKHKHWIATRLTLFAIETYLCSYIGGVAQLVRAVES